MEEDKDIIIAKQNAFIAYLKYEIKELNIEKGKLNSEIDYLNNEKSLNNEIKDKNRKLTFTINETLQLKKELESLRQYKNRLNFNFNFYKQKFVSLLKIQNPENWIEIIKTIEKEEKPLKLN